MCIYLRVAGRVRMFALLKRPRHSRWEAHVTPLKVSQPRRMPWRRRYTISKGCYYADVCASTAASNDDDDDGDGGNNDDDACCWMMHDV